MKYLIQDYDPGKDAAFEIIDQAKMLRKLFPSMVKTLAELFRKRLKKRIQQYNTPPPGHRTQSKRI